MLYLRIIREYSFFVEYNIIPVRKEAPSSFSKESRIAQYYRAIAINYKPFSTLARPPGAEKRIHPKNQKMLDEIRSKENSNQ